MGKWLDRVIERKESKDKNSGDIPNINTDKTDRMPEPIAAHGDVSPSMPHLTDGQREAYQEYLEIMISPKFNLPRNRAENEAFELVTRNRRESQAHQAARDYKLDGFIKIYSAVLGQAIYLTKNERATKRILDKNLPVFTEAELECLQGLKRDEAKTVMEGKIIFGGSIVFQDQLDAKKEN